MKNISSGSSRGSTDIQKLLIGIVQESEDILEQEQFTRLQTKIEDFDPNKEYIAEIISEMMHTYMDYIYDLKSKLKMNIQSKDYNILEEAIQKSEAEIRKHIRIEQQLKLYSDSLQDKIQAYEKTRLEEKKNLALNLNTIKGLQKQKKELVSKIQELQKKIANLQQRKQIKTEKVRTLVKQKSTIETSYEENVSTNNLKEGSKFGFDYKKRKRIMEKLYMQSKPISLSKERSKKDLQNQDLQVSFYKEDQQQLKKRNSMNLKQKNLIKSKPIKDISQLNRTMNVYEESQKRAKILKKKQVTESCETTLNKQMRCNSVCK